ncbi:post-GPI attachment to proteins factor 2-like isoform X2 [Toxorhynchites rutilus septentrionalis]|uniref:post-GPI attachment to proteins factor 2-like isoform X2 n=1 Tax=Toxorhynchites rutilus septentrionalis TaxID=329112 RepID=UPI0024794CD9|nr:post-GPI attachment to proteins factor 2-like isoform X2 [Toxorhynchites rutilus septentrionalis]
MLPQYERIGDSDSGATETPVRSAVRIRFVYNFLPSLSAAIGNYQPQRIVWQFSVLVHALPRYAIAFMYKNYHVGLLRKRRKELAYLACILNITELSSLVGLTLWTSSESYEVHKFCFSTFVIASIIYMLILIVINRITREDMLTVSERKSMKYKKRLFLTNVCSILFAVYFFVRHNNYCEPGVYSLFALSEYVFVYSNIGFHMTAYWDFINANLYFGWRSGIHFSSV